MGARFQLKHANVIAYLTTADASPPRLREGDLNDFLMALAHSRYWSRPTFISSDPSWPESMQRIADSAQRRFDKWGDAFVEERVVRRILAKVRDAFRDFNFFALVVGATGEHDEVTSLGEHFAFRSRAEALVLLPVADHSSEPLTVLDPIPAFATAIEQRRNWPGLLFWSRSGMAAFANVDDAPELFERLLGAARGSEQHTEELDEVLRSFRARDRGVRLLHLSDLHYGRPEAAENEALLLAHLERSLDDVHRVVITGDLFDNPSRQDAVLFRNFRAALIRRTGKDPIVIPGNHDQKWLGNLPAKLRQVADLEWSALVIDDDIQCSFFCFDSSKDADLARGKVTVEQLRDVATGFETTATKNPHVRAYLPLALVHHHPFSFEVRRETLVQKLLGRLGLTDEGLMKMLDADQFLNWVAKRRIPLILHGHKHVQRHFHQSIDTGDKRYDVSAIGCGTSLGAEGYPLSYNVITWDWHSRSWSASFFADPGDGSGFARQCITAQDLPA
jgi:predicted MPP superfamily phosphohydrolase